MLRKYNVRCMRKSTGIFLIFLCIAIIFMAGCTGTEPKNATPLATPTPQIVYVTVLVTPTPTVATVTPEVTEPPISQDVKMNQAFLDYIYENQILERMTELTSASEGVYSISMGYNAEPKRKAENLTALLSAAPKPGSEKMKAFRSAMMDAISMMDGTTAGFSRYREAMQTVTNTKFAALSEMPSLEFSVEPTQFSGFGNNVQSFNSTGTGRKFFTMHHTGKSNFAITLKNENGKYISLLVNEIGSYSGKKSANLTIGKYYLDVTADGAWTIDITSN
jgi:hypothetical protein